jgi:hypothetical protein
LEGSGFYLAIQQLMAQPNSTMGAFPGLHGALTAYLLFWQVSHDRRSLVWCAPLAFLIWLSTLFLGFHYFSDLVSGVLLAAAAVWLAPRLEQLAGLWRRAQHPPLLWLSNLTEGYGEECGKLAGRLGFLQSLGAEISPGLLAGGAPRNRSEEPLRLALRDLGGGPFWARLSEVSNSKRDALSALKPLSLERVIRLVFDSSSKRHMIVQKALKVSAMGLCRCFPPRDMGLSDVEIRMTSLPGGQVLLLRLSANKTFLKGWLDAPWSYFPPSFPLRGFELYDLAKLTRRLAARWGRFTEVEWVLSGGKVLVLDGRPVRGETSSENKPE